MLALLITATINPANCAAMTLLLPPFPACHPVRLTDFPLNAIPWVNPSTMCNITATMYLISLPLARMC